MKVAIAVLGFAALLPSHAVAKAPAPLEVRAKLVKIPSKFPPNDLYDYAYVMKYQVVGGKLDKQFLLVAHYKPREARNKITGKVKKYVSGTLKRFQEGDLHQLKLVPKKRKIWKGA
ncbi:MAG: hypothetical protein JRH20_30275, partial [Deltaproteobacteria bacterium]|nr:hypothetical protein [Deltaproteobacteria bacterium]